VDDKITSEERWRLFVKMLESSEDPEDWIKSFFLMPGKNSAPKGADDPAIQGVDMAKVGRTNIEEVRCDSLICSCQLPADAGEHKSVPCLFHVQRRRP